MQPIRWLVTAWALISTSTAASAAQDVNDICRASSSYDLTFTPQALLFERSAPTSRRIELQAGKLRVDGAHVRMNREDGDRLVLFEHDLRALLPKVKRVAADAVDLAIQSVRAETVGLDLGADTQAELAGQLAAHGAELKRRIADSTSTRDWQGDALDRQVADIVADIAPLLAADLGQQAMAAALAGDLDAAASLRDRAAALGGGLRPRLERRMQALRPQIEALCPSLRRLQELQAGVRGSNGRPLDLLEIDPH